MSDKCIARQLCYRLRQSRSRPLRLRHRHRRPPLRLPAAAADAQSPPAERFVTQSGSVCRSGKRARPADLAKATWGSQANCNILTGLVNWVHDHESQVLNANTDFSENREPSAKILLCRTASTY
eukprot:4242729-Pleurochrysis_carterae.AAC.1